MADTYSINEIASMETLVDVAYTIKKNPARVEECHGMHTFDEDEELSRDIVSIKIEVKDGLWIDITDRLTEGEKKHLLNNI
jgi:hypothetical protein